MTRFSSRPLLRTALLSVLGLGLAACAPATRAVAQTGTQSLAQKPLFMPGGQELGMICTHSGRIARDGSLLWDDSSRQHSQPAPYLVACNDFTLQNDGSTLKVQDDTLAKALTHFDPGARFLQYADALAVRFPESGLVAADPVGLSVPLAAVKVTASQPGTAETALLSGGKVTAFRYDPAQPLTLRLNVPGRTFDWSEVTVQANKGLITAPVPRK
jgi:hypothetical protein